MRIVLLVAMAAAAVLIFTAEPSPGPLAPGGDGPGPVRRRGWEACCSWCAGSPSRSVQPTWLVAFPPVYRKRLSAANLVSGPTTWERVTPSMVGGGTGLRFAPGNRVALLFGAGPACEGDRDDSGRTSSLVVQDSRGPCCSGPRS